MGRILRVNNVIKNYRIILPLAAIGAFPGAVSAQNYERVPSQDVYILKSSADKKNNVWNYDINKDTIKFFCPIFKNPAEDDISKITPEGIPANKLKNIPLPIVNIDGKDEIIQIVVDLSKNILYTYDTNGNPQKAYLIASGKKTTKTVPGVRKISHKEVYPYKNAPENTKRRKRPNDYGVKLLYLVTVDPETGKVTGSNGQFIHGTYSLKSLGKYASHGCVRMCNDAIREVYELANKDSYVLFTDNVEKTI